MISVYVNGEESSVSSTGAPRIGDLVELIKAMIDPDHMITQIHLDGRELEEHEWQANTGQFGTSIIEVETGPVDIYVAGRLERAPGIIASCYLEFRSARKCFQSGDMVSGNKALVEGVNALKAFFEWFGTIVALLPEEDRSRYEITPHVKGITETCKRICQQQLYQSWWALGESIEKELEPKLDKLEDALRRGLKTR